MPSTLQCGAFTCGDPSIDEALRNDLLVAIGEGRNRGYYLDYHGQIVAFASLRAATFELDVLDRQQFPLTRPSVSGIRVELFAVAKQYQGGGKQSPEKSVGQRLMTELIAIAQEAAELIGARFLAVESVPAAQSFYSRMGFFPTTVQKQNPRDTSGTIFMLLDLKEP